MKEIGVKFTESYFRQLNTYLGSIRSSRFSVIRFSIESCSVRSATTASKLCACFSIMASMLSKMFDFLATRKCKHITGFSAELVAPPLHSQAFHLTTVLTGVI